MQHLISLICSLQVRFRRTRENQKQPDPDIVFFTIFIPELTYPTWKDTRLTSRCAPWTKMDRKKDGPPKSAVKQAPKQETGKKDSARKPGLPDSLTDFTASPAKKETKKMKPTATSSPLVAKVAVGATPAVTATAPVVGGTPPVVVAMQEGTANPTATTSRGTAEIPAVNTAERPVVAPGGTTGAAAKPNVFEQVKQHI